MGEKQDTTEFSLRSFSPGDEADLVEFLNRCYPGSWGDMEQWAWLYPQSPSFQRDNVFIIEKGNQIVGHRGLHPRQLVVRGGRVPVTFLGDTAIHPDCQGHGLYGWLHQATLEAAKARGACLALTGNSRGSVTYHHNKKTGFIEVRQSHTYLKLLNAEGVFWQEILNFITRREKLKALLRGLADELYLQFGGMRLSLKQLLQGDKPAPLTGKKKGRVRIILSESSFPLLITFATGGKLRKVKSLLALLLGRKMRMRFSSPLALARVAWAGVRMMKHA